MRCAVVCAAIAAALTSLAGCQSKPPETVVVLPGPEGRTGTVVVDRGKERTVLDRPYAATRAGAQSGPVQLDEQQVKETFGPTLAKLPERPASFLLYFVTGTDELTEESKVELTRMLAELKRRPEPDIVVIGHTDTVGAQDHNDKLSLQRAERVRTDFVAQGLRGDRIRAAGRGKREPLVPTADGVDEPRNRRVEINVR